MAIYVFSSPITTTAKATAPGLVEAFCPPLIQARTHTQAVLCVYE